MKVDQFFLIVDDQRRDFSFWFHSFFCDVFVWKWGSRPRTSSRCYHGNKSAATFKNGIFVYSPWAPNYMQNLKGGLKMFISQDVWFLQRLVLKAYNRHFLAIYRTWHPRMYCWLSCFQRFPVMLCSVCLHDECGIWTTVVMLNFRFQR